MRRRRASAAGGCPGRPRPPAEVAHRPGRGRPPAGGGCAVRVRVGRRRPRRLRPPSAGAWRGLAERGSTYAAGALPTQKVYPLDVTVAEPVRRPAGRPPKHPIPSAASAPVAALFAGEDAPAPTRTTISRRRGTKGPLAAAFAARRGCVWPTARPTAAPSTSPARRCGWRARSAPAASAGTTSPTTRPTHRLAALAAAIKARWACGQAHRQLMRELGLGHDEGRGWPGLHHHLVPAQIAFAFLQHPRRRGKKRPRVRAGRRPATAAGPAGDPAPPTRPARPCPAHLPVLPAPLPISPARVNLAE